MSFRPLSMREKRKIAEHDGEVYEGPNRTRFYKWLVVLGADVEVRTVAVKADRKGVRFVKEVVRGSVEKGFVEVTDLVYVPLAGYAVDWSPEGIGRRMDWSYKGEWGRERWTRRGKWALTAETVNLDALKSAERFRYCAYEAACGDILAYLKHYADNPRIELLVKAGLGRFARLAGFCGLLALDNGMMRFLSAHLEEIRAAGYGADAVGLAYRHGLTLQAAQMRLDCAREFGKAGGLPKGIDPVRARAYVTGQTGATCWEYCRYLAGCVRLGFDIADTKVAYPKAFNRRAAEVGDMVAVRVRQERDLATREEKRRAREWAKRRLAEFAGQAAKLSAVDGAAFGPFVIRVPKSEEDFKREGNTLGHCVFSMGYLDKMARGACVIVFVRKRSRPESPFFTVELDPDGKALRQCYGKGHARPDDRLGEFVKGRLLSAVRSAMKGKR